VRLNSISKQVVAALLLTTWILAPSAQPQIGQTSVAALETSLSHASTQESFVRTELYFGTARQNLAPVSDAEWREFLDRVITNRFPEGLTVVTADGQFQNDTGSLSKERSFLLILLYPQKEWKKRNESIEFIRDAYKDAFEQQSVLRVDYGPPVKESF
jgi:hypothetical protein